MASFAQLGTDQPLITPTWGAQQGVDTQFKEPTTIQKVAKYTGAFFLGLAALPVAVAFTAIAIPGAVVGTVVGGAILAAKSVFNGVSSALKGSSKPVEAAVSRSDSQEAPQVVQEVLSPDLERFWGNQANARLIISDLRHNYRANIGKAHLHLKNLQSTIENADNILQPNSDASQRLRQTASRVREQAIICKEDLEIAIHNKPSK